MLINFIWLALGAVLNDSIWSPVLEPQAQYTLACDSVHDFSIILNFFRPKRLTLRAYKDYWFVFKDTTISYYKNKEVSSGEPIEQFHLRGE